MEAAGVYYSLRRAPDIGDSRDAPSSALRLCGCINAERLFYIFVKCERLMIGTHYDIYRSCNYHTLLIKVYTCGSANTPIDTIYNSFNW